MGMLIRRVAEERLTIRRRVWALSREQTSNMSPSKALDFRKYFLDSAWLEGAELES